MFADTAQVDPVDLNLARRTTIGDALTRTADRVPHSIAVVDRDRRISYAQLEHDAEAIARGIIALDDGPAQGEPCAMLMRNSSEVLAVYFGIVKAGRVALPVNDGLTAEDIAWILTDAQATTLFADEALLPLVREVAAAGATLTTIVVHTEEAGTAEPAAAEAPGGEVPQGAARHELRQLVGTEVGPELCLAIGSDDAAQCLYTSGTTANPKGALAAHAAVVTGAMSNALQMSDGWGREPGTVLIVLPLFHVTALNTLAMPVLFTGGTVVIQHGFDPAAVLDAMEAERITMFTGLPMMWAALIAENQRRPRDLSSMDTAMYAMAQMPERVLAGMDEMMPDAKKVLGSGQTEVIPATTYQRPHHRHGKNGSWGIPSPTVRTQIMDPDGNLLPVGEVGEIVYRGPHVTLGYWNRPDANGEAFRHGWFHSGDIGYLDDEGVVWFTDRVKDIIKTGGENVSSMKVERVVANAPGVVECCVIGTEHAHWGEAVTAVVLSDTVPARGEVGDEERERAQRATEEGILAYAREHLSGIEAPKRVEFVDALPKTTTGKIRKNVLRGLF
ncbi:AMP-binding protein [Brevibacterium sp. BRM-1]|nr:AMP-binding protein [Brevibacterium sp. BRM-1]WAL40634.1 AMP-binding protein [Brevibacterium sp. BRM-1]